MRPVSRRTFLAGTAAIAGAATLHFASRNVLGANEKVQMGFIGVGGRGAYSAEWFNKLKGEVNVAALCDADASIVAKVAKKHEGATTCQDMRKIIDDKSINAVVISTCNHWHALAAVWAMQAGKDVYVEKPVSQTVWEGRKMIEAARKYNRVVQGGMQQRSDAVQDEIRQFIKSGQLGKMLYIRGNRYGTRLGIGKVAEPIKPPSGVDYNLWLGPAQDLPMLREKFHYDWHWVWNTGSGEMGNWGVHVLDDIRNMLDDKCTLPKRIAAGGGRVLWNDAGETPNAHFVYFDTGIVPVYFDLSNLPASNDPKRSTQSLAYRKAVQSGYVIQFENGWYGGGRGGGKAYDKDNKAIKSFKGDGGGDHARNFINAIKSRNSKSLKAEIEQAHYSAAWCHLANIAFRLGASYKQGAVADMMKNDAAWKELVEGFEKHMDTHGVKLDSDALKVSPILDIDVEKEVFTGPTATPQAQALLTREYRKGFVLPAEV